MPPSGKEAADFFAELRAGSIEVLRRFGLPESPKDKTVRWKHGRPVGAVLHYTAGVDWKGPARWLNGAQNRSSSCHFLVLDRKLDEVQDIAARFLAMAGLDVLALMLADLDAGTWHATWANTSCVGIENRNAGLLRERGGRLFWGGDDWKAEFPAGALGKTAVEIDGRWWEPYTRGQIAADVAICRMLQALHADEGGLDPSWIVPHSCISGGKMDTGRSFPVAAVRDAILGIEPLEWLDAYDGAPAPFDACGHADLGDLLAGGKWRDRLDAVRRGLGRLGYAVSGAGPDLDPVTSQAVYMFQKSRKLATDRVPGRATRKAIHARLAQFGLHR
jgi:N-acetyl-anhydromuramyl-L-alanine amidase AmpD